MPRFTARVWGQFTNGELTEPQDFVADGQLHTVVSRSIREFKKGYKSRRFAGIFTDARPEKPVRQGVTEDPTVTEEVTNV